MSFGRRDITKEQLRRAGSEVLSDSFGTIWRPDRGMIIAVFDDRPTAEKVLKSQGFKKQRAGKIAPDALWKRGATGNPKKRKNPEDVEQRLLAYPTYSVEGVLDAVDLRGSLMIAGKKFFFMVPALGAADGLARTRRALAGIKRWVGKRVTADVINRPGGAVDRHIVGRSRIRLSPAVRGNPRRKNPEDDFKGRVWLLTPEVAFGFRGVKPAGSTFSLTGHERDAEGTLIPAGWYIVRDPKRHMGRVLIQSAGPRGVTERRPGAMPASWARDAWREEMAEARESHAEYEDMMGRSRTTAVRRKNSGESRWFTVHNGNEFVGNVEVAADTVGAAKEIICARYGLPAAIRVQLLDVPAWEAAGEKSAAQARRMHEVLSGGPKGFQLGVRRKPGKRKNPAAVSWGSVTPWSTTYLKGRGSNGVTYSIESFQGSKDNAPRFQVYRGSVPLRSGAGGKAIGTCRGSLAKAQALAEKDAAKSNPTGRCGRRV